MGLATPFTQRARPRLSLKACRPALVDLRFKGDAWVVSHGDQRAAVCLGDYPLTLIDASPLDLPSLNRVLSQVRTGQARRNIVRRTHRLGV